MAVVRKAREYIGNHYQEPVSLQSVAEALDISYGYLSRCFKNVEGVAFTQYLTHVRLEKAKELMRVLVGRGGPRRQGCCRRGLCD